MAVTKIWTIKDSLQRVLDYAANPDKTEYDALAKTLHYAENDAKTKLNESAQLVTGIHCRADHAWEDMRAVQERFGKTDGVVALHAYQSFREGEVTPEQCHEIGVALARKVWGKRFQVLVATHMNTDNLHNHFVINSVSYLDQEPSYGGRDYLEKQDYILMKQKEQLAAQEQKLEELTLKIEDMETLLDNVSDAAYDKAVEVVTDTVRQETHKEDIRLVEESKKWVVSPERKAPKKEREYAAERLDGVITKIKNAMQHALAKIQRTLMQPEVKQAGKEQVKKKAKESIMDMLAKAKINADRDNRERWEREGRIAPKKKHDMEL